MAPRSFAKPLAICVTLPSFFLCIFGVLTIAPVALRGYVDFRQLYTAGYMVRTGHPTQLYDYEATEKLQNEIVSPAEGALPFNHLAYESLFFAPFSLLRYRTAYVLFLILNLMLLAAALRLLRPYLDPLAEVWSLLPVLLFVCFVPVTIALLEGQDSIILLALMICATRALDTGADLKAGALVALTLFKFQYALPIALLFLVWRRWRFLGGFALTAAAVVALSLWLTGPAAFVSYFHSLTEMSVKFSPAYSVRYGIHLEAMPNLRGFAQMAMRNSPSAPLVLTLMLSAFTLIWTAARPRSLPLAVLAGVLVSYHHLISDTALLVLPVGLALSVATPPARSSRSMLMAVLSALVWFGPAPLLLAGVRFYLLAIPMLALLFVWDGRYISPGANVR
jgi:Glycosyltransferase family 87